VEPDRREIFSDHNPFQGGSTTEATSAQRNSGDCRKEQAQHIQAKFTNGPIPGLTSPSKRSDGNKPVPCLLEPRNVITYQSILAYSTSAIVIVLVVIGLYWRQMKIEAGYCSARKDTTDFFGATNSLRLAPKCEPCPDNSRCFPYFNIRCDDHFILKPHPLALGGLIPLRPTCVPDNRKAQQVRYIAAQALKELRSRRVEWECTLGEVDRSHTVVPEAEELMLKHHIAEKHGKKIDQYQFNDRWAEALQDLIAKEEVKNGTNGLSLTATNSPVTKSELAVCVVSGFLHRHFVYGCATLLIITILFGALKRIHTVYTQWHKSNTGEMENAVHTAILYLSKQQILYQAGCETEPYIPIEKLRDAILHYPKRREWEWKLVSHALKTNSNITLLETDRGTYMKWNGPVSIDKFDIYTKGCCKHGRFNATSSRRK
jgi:hypothetical protein